MAPALYGMIIGVAFFVFTRLLPQPLGSIVYWGLLSVQLAWGAVLTWRRTALPFATAGLVTGAATATSLVVLAAIGHPYPNEMPQSWLLLSGGFIVAPLFLLIESRVNPAKWKQWAQHMENKSAWDIVTGRHIPQLRNGGA